MSLFFIPPVKKNISERSLFPIVAADVLLASNHRKAVVENIRRQTVDISDEHFNILYQSLINNFVEFVQLLPTNNEAQLGSLMDEGLSRASFALQQQKDAAEDQQPDPLLVYTLFSAALLFDVGFAINNRTVMISEKDGTFIKEWLPNKGKMQQLDGGYYRIRFGGGMPSELSRRATPLVAQQLMPLAGFNWIAQDPDAFDSWIVMLNNEKEVANDLKLYLDYANKKVLAEPAKEFFSAMNVSILEPQETALGEDFLEWLKNGLDTEAISINAYDSDIHIIEDGLFLEIPEIINKFCAQSPKKPAWEAVFAQLKKIGFVNLSETSEQLATYTYNYAEPVKQQLDAQRQEANNKQQAQNVASKQESSEPSKKPLIRRGIKIFIPCFLFYLLAKHFHLFFGLTKRAKAKLKKKKLKVLERSRRYRQRLKERIREIEEATLLKMNLNRESLEVAGKEFKKWLKKLNTPFYDGGS